jgi:2-methylisocitrate lyase-like PEP mutase family enzyme
MQPTQQEKGAAFRALHEGPAFLIPNPWDAGSARVLAALGFKALATTSSGFAFTLGRPDGGASLEEVAEHARVLDRATALPVSVDLENGHGREPEDAARAIARVAEAGAVGGSIEDWDPSGELYSLEHAAERVAAAAEAAYALGFPFTLTGRAENHIRGVDDLDDTIARLVAYRDAGADCVYAPGLTDIDHITAVVDAVGVPVNVLALGAGPPIPQLAAAGVRRVSTGSLPAGAAYGALHEAAVELLDVGTSNYAKRHIPRDALRDALGPD